MHPKVRQLTQGVGLPRENGSGTRPSRRRRNPTTRSEEVTVAATKTPRVQRGLEPLPVQVGVRREARALEVVGVAGVAGAPVALVPSFWGLEVPSRTGQVTAMV